MICLMEYTFVIEEAISLACWFYLFGVYNGFNYFTLFTQGIYYRLGLKDGITTKYTLGIPLGTYDTLGVHLVDDTDDGILIEKL